MMAMHEIPELDRKGLRNFGFVTGGLVAGLFGLILPWFLDVRIPVWPWIVGGILALWAVVAPDTLKSIYRAWMRFGLLLSRITTPLILGLVFFLVFVPFALAMRLMKRDSMMRKLDTTATTYRVASRQPPREGVERPF
jgi:hypothetical protein